MSGHVQADTKAGSPDPRDVGIAPGPRRGSTPPWVVEIAAAAEHPLGALDRPNQIDLSRQVVFVPVGAPLPEVAVHVEKPPGVRLELPHWPRPGFLVARVSRRRVADIVVVAPACPFQGLWAVAAVV